ncbi:AT-hook motif nuclear-localized protein 10 [Capsicum baccatum]|uniref:AT-hook motif nuclear-localized protein n=1 Tax=Capsicum baccatum TaxID=33114 RepID=A0A2G2VID2_CAPBA|nr:AT-hook motif nuclear-localized protein 10 [Capsicum baccatum]
MENCKPGDVSVVKGDKLSLDLCPKNDLMKDSMKDVPYSSVVGNLMYAQVCTHPDIDIAFTVNLIDMVKGEDIVIEHMPIDLMLADLLIEGLRPIVFMQHDQNVGVIESFDLLGTTGFGRTPHIISVNAGEDVAYKIMLFSQNAPRAVCILSAAGAISNVTLRQTFDGTVTYEGRFDIVSLSGSFIPSEIGSQQSKKGGFSVSLARSDGRIFGGGVAGLLTVASPVQVIVASFFADGREESTSTNDFEASPSPLDSNLDGSTGSNSPPSRGTSSESSGGQGSPLNLSGPVCNNEED